MRTWHTQTHTHTLTHTHTHTQTQTHTHTHMQVDKQTLTEEALELLSLVPAGYIPLPHQVGGHRHVDGKLGEG